MPSRRGHVDHFRLKRKLHVKKSLEAREPPHIVGPAVGPNTPAPSPIPPPGGRGGGNGGGGRNGSGGGGGGNDNGGGGGENSGGGGGTSGGGGNGDNGRGDSNGGGGGGNGRGGGNNSNGGGGNGSGGNSGNGGGNANGGGVGTSNAGAGEGANNNPTSTPAPVPLPVGGIGIMEPTNGEISTVPSFGAVNAGTNPILAVSSTTSSAVTTVSPSTGLPSSSQSQSSIINDMNNGGGDDNGSDTGPTSSSTNVPSQNHGLSAGRIAGIVILLLVIGMAALVLLLRKRAIAHRIKHRRWFAKGGVSAGLYADYDSPRNSAVATSRRPGSPPGSRSARSSFATTFDQSHSLKLDLDFDAFLPPVPPMAEIRGEGPLVLSGTPSSLVPANNSKSTGSGNSNSSEYLLFPPGTQGDRAIGTPMSVRPFSPSESYSFPRPPPSQEEISLPYKDGDSHDERADKHWSMSNASQKSPAAATNANPFADPDPAAIATQADFADIEMIQRRFVSTLSDELAVAVGDRVKILQTFDDGWALVQKLPPANDKKGKAKAVDEFDQGLIPINCLRNAGQDLPAFLAQKRVSSYLGGAGAVSGKAI